MIVFYFFYLFIVLEYKTYQVREVKLLEVHCLLKLKSYKWQDIGRGLKVDFGKRTGFGQDVTRNNEDKLEVVLNEWIQSQCSEVSYNHLIEVLQELSLNDVAEKVKSFRPNELLADN